MSEDKWLGKQVEYPEQYAPEMLVGVDRKLNRQFIGIQSNDLPFSGIDIWHAYEFSCLTSKGLPVVAVLKLCYPASSPNLIESKSLKLYLNSFNMSRFGNSKTEALDEVCRTITTDLTNIAGAPVMVQFHSEDIPAESTDFEDFKLLENEVDADQLTFTSYAENPAELARSEGGLLQVYSQLLRSNCKITFQPDWGNIYIHLRGNNLPSFESLLKYIVSFRDEKHFHEEICESVFFHLNRIFQPDELMVCCIYTRRGGIDICPVRASHPELIPPQLTNVKALTRKHLRQ